MTSKQDSSNNSKKQLIKQEAVKKYITETLPFDAVSDEPREIRKSTLEIGKYISDKRILRVLLENNIFELREIQKAAIKQGLFFQKSFLICAPSGSGKTLIGELCAIHNILEEFGKSIYLVPFKALATEKYIHFKKNYSRFNIKIGLSIGDFELNEEELKKSDLIVTTYEKMDSILRNFNEKDWIHEISTIIIDEIHMIGEEGRGPRLESLIIRLNEFLYHPQIIGLSATIANPEFFNTWLSSLGNKTTLIKSDVRPVPLHYRIEISGNKTATIRKYIKAILSQEGQVLIFVNTRKDSQVLAQEYMKLIPQFLKPEEKEACKRLSKKLEKVNGNNKDLERMISHGIAFHHAGLLPKERKLVEDNFRKRNIKVICCTTTLSAGVNTPARLVILKKFKKHVTSGYNLTNFSGYFEMGDGFSFFKPFSANEVFQMLGRAGRPGLDPLGYGIILVKDLEEKLWVEDNYFQPLRSDYILKPKYNDLVSTLNDVSVLTEQVLLRIYEEKRISLEKLKQFFERTYFYHEFKNRGSRQDISIPIEQFLMIKEIKPVNILKMYSASKNLVNIKKKIKKVQLNAITSSKISGYLQTQYGVFECSFHVSRGIICSCGFKNGFSDNFGNTKNLFEFCNHILAFLMHLIEYPDPKVQKYVEDIIPKSLRRQYILNYLLEKGLLKKDEKNTFFCTAFGKLVIRLYIAPSSAVLIRKKLENKSINTYMELLKEAFNILKEEGKVRRDDFFEPLLDWCDEVPLDEILDRYNIMAGDLFTLRENVVRNIIFIQKIAEFLSRTGTDLRESMFNVMEMAETLSIRVEHGIKEELFDLVLRLNQVGRVRARILFNAGYKNASEVRKETPYTLHIRTGLGINLCKAILKSK